VRERDGREGEEVKEGKGWIMEGIVSPSPASPVSKS